MTSRGIALAGGGHDDQKSSNCQTSHVQAHFPIFLGILHCLLGDMMQKSMRFHQSTTPLPW